MTTGEDLTTFDERVRGRSWFGWKLRAKGGSREKGAEEDSHIRKAPLHIKRKNYEQGEADVGPSAGIAKNSTAPSSRTVSHPNHHHLTETGVSESR